MVDKRYIPLYFVGYFETNKKLKPNKEFRLEKMSKEYHSQCNFLFTASVFLIPLRHYIGVKSDIECNKLNTSL